ncbi:MAG TPA: hypothetical protein DCZ69_14540 [Syntrophobacteraceae bacterium]|nr:hypothetical protein [Syntrophobacteraceae bacterium]HBD09470.1 hypothetical protein [Syntrophobacteraceae bacterium]HBZ56300.1 hypothetical protein [Syntrophobacteraceae bacterium]
MVQRNQKIASGSPAEIRNHRTSSVPGRNNPQRR